jgi:hypothetical protein
MQRELRNLCIDGPRTSIFRAPRSLKKFSNCQKIAVFWATGKNDLEFVHTSSRKTGFFPRLKWPITY